MEVLYPRDRIPLGILMEQRYEFQERLGQGGMGVVAKVRDRFLDREVAVKTLLPDLARDAESVSRFVREARAVGQFQHPNIPPVHELSKLPDGTPYFSMRFVDGETLGKVIERLAQGDAETHRRYSFMQRLQVVEQVCDALHYVHSLQFVHRDIKPDNIMLGPFGEVQVMDWGLTRKIASPSPSSSPDSKPALTSAGCFLGTLGYAAPEQIVNPEEVDQRTDIHALGAVLYELCCLTPAFPGEQWTDVMNAVLTKKPRIPESFVHPVQGRVPREISKLIMKCLQPKAENRFQTALELREALQKIVEGSSPVVCPHTAMKRALRALGHFLDNHNSFFTVALVYLWVGLPVLLIPLVIYLFRQFP